MRPLENYSFIDLGCGKGRAVLMASEYGFREVVGVELHPWLAGIAEANVAAWTAAGRAVCPVRIVCQDATEFVFPDGACLLYLFNPFAAPVMKQLIERIEADFAERPGLLDLIYFNPEAGAVARGAWRLRAVMDRDRARCRRRMRRSDLVASPEDLCSVYRWIGDEAIEIVRSCYFSAW